MINLFSNLTKPFSILSLSLQYDSDRKILNLKVLGALNLPWRYNKEKQIPPDPYVKVFKLYNCCLFVFLFATLTKNFLSLAFKLTMLPDRQIKLTTKTLRSTCNPLFNQTFELDMANIQNIFDVQLSLMVRDRPDLSRYVQNQYENTTRSGRLRSVTLGQATISLFERNTVDKQVRQVRWCFLEDPSPSLSNFKAAMVIIISLKALPNLYLRSLIEGLLGLLSEFTHMCRLQHIAQFLTYLY